MARLFLTPTTTPTAMKILGITGAAGAGKDTAAELLAFHAGGEVTAFTHHLYVEVARAFDASVPMLIERGTKELPQRWLALVTVWLKGKPWVIVDITLRMLAPRELYNAQDFPTSYVIDRTAAGKALTKTAQVRMCGNSVSPLPLRLIVAANYCEAAQPMRRVA